MSDDSARARELRARQALRAGDWDLAEGLVARGDATLHELIEHIRIYQAELEMQAHELEESRVRRERALRRFTGLFSMLPLAALLVDEHGLIVEANREAERMFGSRLLHLRSHSVLRVVGGAGARQQLQQALTQARDGGRASIDAVPVTTGVQDLYADVVIEHVPPDDDHGEQFILLLADRTERVLAQRALATSEEARRRQESETRTLAMVAARTESLVIITDAEGRVTWVNEGFRRATGYELADLAGRSPGAVLQGPGTDPATVAYMRERLRSGQGFTGVEVLNYDRAGKPYWLGLDVQPVTGPDGRIECFVAVEHDITERRMAEQTLRASEEFRRAVFENDPSALVVLRRDGSIQVSNPAAQALLGGAVAEPNAPLRDLLAPDARAAFDTLLSEALNGAVQDSELVLPDAAGASRTVELRASPLWLAGVVNGALVSLRDVTALRELEEARRQKRAAELASEAKTRFLSRMSHELRTPLNAVIGFAQLAQSERVGALDAVQRERLVHIESASQHLLAMINEILQLSQIEAGHMSMSLRPCPLDPLLAESLGQLQAQRAARGVELVLDVKPGLWVQGDPIRLTEVFNNLLSNAIKYNNDGGKVEVVARLQGDRVHFQVRDSGIGLNAEQLEHLYEPFNRLGAERTRIEGTGMGLVVTRSLLALMGGALQVASTPGVGTVFSFDLPVAVAEGGAAAEPPAALSAPAEATPPLRLLYVEDNELNAIVLQQMLARWRPHWTLEVAVDGMSGIAACRAVPPDLALLDITLPDMSGLDVRAQLLRDPVTAGVPCLALSASVLPEERRAAFAAGFADYAGKPIEIVGLIATIERLTARRAA